MNNILFIVVFSYINLGLNQILNARSQSNVRGEIEFYSADNKFFEYVGRFDFSDIVKSRAWAPAAYIQTCFLGETVKVHVKDEYLYGQNYNYIHIVIDDTLLFRTKFTTADNIISFPEKLQKGKHKLLICKDTEASIGHIDFIGIECEKLLPFDDETKLKFEFIGNSITCGAGSMTHDIPCSEDQWYDQNCAYLAYGPRIARALNAQWHQSSVSGIDLIHSCCNSTTEMPEIFHRTSLGIPGVNWNFLRYVPDVLTICLEQNDGIQDSVLFVNAYVNFIKLIRTYYPNTRIVCLTNPMSSYKLSLVLKSYLTEIVRRLNDEGDKRVYKYFFSKHYRNGCGGHPDIEEHKQIADELIAFFRNEILIT